MHSTHISAFEKEDGDGDEEEPRDDGVGDGERLSTLVSSMQLSAGSLNSQQQQIQKASTAVPKSTAGQGAKKKSTSSLPRRKFLRLTAKNLLLTRAIYC